MFFKEEDLISFGRNHIYPVRGKSSNSLGRPSDGVGLNELYEELTKRILWVRDDNPEPLVLFEVGISCEVSPTALCWFGGRSGSVIDWGKCLYCSRGRS
jgi:hypothetical protein